MSYIVIVVAVGMIVYYIMLVLRVKLISNRLQCTVLKRGASHPAY